MNDALMDELKSVEDGTDFEHSSSSNGTDPSKPLARLQERLKPWSVANIMMHGRGKDAKVFVTCKHGEETESLDFNPLGYFTSYAKIEFQVLTTLGLDLNIAQKGAAKYAKEFVADLRAAASYIAYVTEAQDVRQLVESFIQDAKVCLDVDMDDQRSRWSLIAALADERNGNPFLAGLTPQDVASRCPVFRNTPDGCIYIHSDQLVRFLRAHESKWSRARIYELLEESGCILRVNDKRLRFREPEFDRTVKKPLVIVPASWL